MTGRKFDEEMHGGLKARRYNDGSGTYGDAGVPDEPRIILSGWRLDRGGDTITDANGTAKRFVVIRHSRRRTSQSATSRWA